MSRRSVTLLICFFAVEATRYGDYSGARMPHYGTDYENKDPVPLSGEYSDRSPDALASFDYKYGEEQDKNNSPDQDDSWHKSSRKRKTPLKATDDTLEIDENEHIDPKFKSNHRVQKHRTRIKDLHKESYRKHYQYDRNRNNDFDDVVKNNEYKLDKDGSRDDNRIDLDNIDFRDTTRKVVRRKPRDRTINLERLDNGDIRDVVHLDFKEKEGDEDEETEHQEQRRLHTTLKRPRVPFSGLKKNNHRNYQGYDDYYDMKRLNNIKNKLPGLFRQTKASTITTESPSMRRFQDGTYRRANLPEKDIQINIVTDAISTETPTLTISVILLNQTTPTTEESTSISPDLSLAEKSRLSILKKAQRKDSSRNASLTTKPPVLMQVTKQMQTLVMVEPPKQDLHFRARVVFDDSPERIAKAKRLMRRKLVAGARSIQDLVDNWDEMICDYIDVSLLDSGDNHHPPSDLKIILLSVINCLISKEFV